MALETEKLAHPGLLTVFRQTWLPDYCQPLWEVMGGGGGVLFLLIPSVLLWFAGR